MDFLSDSNFIWTGFNLAVMLYVVYDLYQELGTIFIYIARVSKQEGFALTFVNRLSSRVYFILLLASAGLIFIVKNSEMLESVMIIAPVALLIGFFVHALTDKLCFISDVGLGSVTQNLEPEIPWQEIRAYTWKENVLALTLDRKWPSRKRIKFNDSSAIVAVNEHLKNLMDARKQ
jgi:hypothetical protein